MTPYIYNETCYTDTHKHEYICTQIHIFILPQQGIHKLVYNITININIAGKYGHKGALIKR